MVSGISVGPHDKLPLKHGNLSMSDHPLFSNVSSLSI